ncbi:uncharacterized protein LOC127508531 isoform X2 [Ctenopharyngodon idella]|uniref:uncharacterized protein LOC127508531 isoform X1 n=1 Tax=Ctenopharyngodon idella TaxID=7959 RepID=UPI0022319624|nr:uncharacterized protein LOC127508531 isoform X1 [Ctenopharyngodon idella]XP_051742546.1 uncharacterized protein LOC127508531 isoform X2 [Ctenopharyngodon idella]
MANTTGFKTRINKRFSKELFLEGKHISIQDLKMREDIRQEQQVQKYLSKDITCYPTPVEFHITEVAHATNKTSLPEIWDSEGFRGLNMNSFSWWSLKINEADIRAAEERFLESSIPNRSKEEIAAQQPFLSKFTTSPAFNNENSRYGNFRFTFPLTELMEAYKKQMCEGEEPVLRVYETKLFKQEIEYVVLVHSPQNNEKFSQYPLLTSSPLVSYDGNQVIWRAQAICETHNFQLEITGNTAVTQYMYSHQFYVWDQVSLVFHVNGVLTFPKTKLKASLSCCEHDQQVNLSHGENCSSLDEAEKFTESLPDDEFKKEDEKEEDKSGDLNMEVD